MRRRHRAAAGWFILVAVVLVLGLLAWLVEPDELLRCEPNSPIYRAPAPCGYLPYQPGSATPWVR